MLTAMAAHPAKTKQGINGAPELAAGTGHSGQNVLLMVRTSAVLPRFLKPGAGPT
jgi:hypothetical protein